MVVTDETIEIVEIKNPPVFQMIKVDRKKEKKMFRHWGQVRIIDRVGAVKILFGEGYERAYPQTHKGAAIEKDGN